MAGGTCVLQCGVLGFLPGWCWGVNGWGFYMAGEWDPCVGVLRVEVLTGQVGPLC